MILPRLCGCVFRACAWWKRALLSNPLSAPKETGDKWLPGVLISIPKCMLAARLSQHLRYLVQSPCWHPDSSALLISLPPLNSWASLPPASHTSITSPLLSWPSLLFALSFSHSSLALSFTMAQFSLLAIFDLLLSLPALDCSWRLWLYCPS